MSPARMRAIPRAAAAAPEAARWLGHLTPGQVMCRSFGHSWQPHTAEWIAAEGSFKVVLVCTRCSTGDEEMTRTLWLSNEGRPQVGGGYHYPHGYVMPKGTGGFNPVMRGAVRLRLMETLVH